MRIKSAQCVAQQHREFASRYRKPSQHQQQRRVGAISYGDSMCAAGLASAMGRACAARIAKRVELLKFSPPTKSQCLRACRHAAKRDARRNARFDVPIFV